LVDSQTVKGNDACIEARSWMLEFQVSKDEPRYELQQR